MENPMKTAIAVCPECGGAHFDTPDEDDSNQSIYCALCGADTGLITGIQSLFLGREMEIKAEVKAEIKARAGKDARSVLSRRHSPACNAGRPTPPYPPVKHLFHLIRQI